MVKVECEHCGHQWNYSGNAVKPTCPSCNVKTNKLEPAEVTANE